MIGGGRCEIDTGAFQNDMTSFRSKDDILTLLVHLGYLAYDKYCKEVYIPNEEIREEFIRAVRNSGWEKIVNIFSDCWKQHGLWIPIKWQRKLYYRKSLKQLLIWLKQQAAGMPAVSTACP